MTSASGDTWFVARVNTHGRRKGIAPVSRAGYLVFVAFVIGEIAALLAGFAVLYAMPDQMILGIAIMVIGVGLTMTFLFVMVARHTDYTMTLNDYRAQQARIG
jgi:ABC-type uncharacterized transport system permease subunit